jgi:hypothetical protein
MSPTIYPLRDLRFVDMDLIMRNSRRAFNVMDISTRIRIFNFFFLGGGEVVVVYIQ